MSRLTATEPTAIETEKIGNRESQLRAWREEQARTNPWKLPTEGGHVRYKSDAMLRVEQLEAEVRRLKRQLAERNVTCPECEARRNATAARVRKHRAKGKKNARHDGVDN